MTFGELENLAELTGSVTEQFVGNMFQVTTVESSTNVFFVKKKKLKKVSTPEIPSL
jgi:hypothetical protein